MALQKSPKEIVLITGGGGYLGVRLGSALCKKGISVILFDVNIPIQDLPKGMKLIRGDICCFTDLEKALQDVTCVFHIASFGMSGKEQLNYKVIEAVNIKGTENVLRACRRKGVPRLVYTSTYNVVFGGQVIINGDESLPYLPLHLHPDHYSRTKSVAEKIVLEANGTALERGVGVLRTCALRSAGIYGPGEKRHLPRLVRYIEKGYFKFVYGDPKSLVDFVHVDNLVQAHILASEALKADKKYIASGQPYFISDERPVNNFEFFRPLVEGLGYPFPTKRLPLTLIYFIALMTEMVYFLFGRFYNFQPFLTRTEVYKTGVTHYFSIEKARKELGYKAQPFDFKEVIDWFKAKGHGRKFQDYTLKYLIWNGMLIFLLAIAVLTWFQMTVATSV